MMTYPFENDTGKVVRRLAKRSMEADRRRNIFAVITIALAVCLMGVLLFLYSAQRLQALEHIQGQYQAGCSGMSMEEIQRLVDAGKFEKWGYTAGVGRIRYGDTNLNISFVDPGMIELMEYGGMTGDYPQAEQELCVERSFLEHYGFPADTGQRISLDLGKGEALYTVTGILETEGSGREFTFWISEAAALAEGDPKPYELRFRFASGQAADTEQLQRDIEAFFEEMGIPKDRTFFSSNYFKMAHVYLGNSTELYIMAALIALVCGIVIYNIFYISVMGKMREYGRLKVLGATPKQLKGVVKRERRFLTVLAIPLGLVTAAVITWAVMPGYWSWPDNIRYGAVISVLMYLAVLVAARKPLELAGRVSAIEAVRATAYAGQAGPGVSRQLHRRLTISRLALMNFSRSRKKAVVTSLSLSLTGILLICIAAYANSADAKEMAIASFGDGGDYLLTQPEGCSGQAFIDVQRDNPLGEALQEQLCSLPDVDHITTYSVASVQIPEIEEDEAFEIRGLTREQMSDMYGNQNILDGKADYQQLLEQDGILVVPGGDTLKNVYGAGYQVGDTVTLCGYNGRTKTYTVMGIAEEVSVGSALQFFILPEEKLHELYPEISDFTAYINIHAGQDSERLRQAVFGTVTDGRIAISALSDMVSVMEAGLEKEMKKFYGILIFVFIFSLINLANTLITNLLSRQQEFGIFQSVGMSSRQLSQMLSFECLLYVGIALLVTLTAGTVCSIIVCRIFDQIGTFGKITWHFPTAEMLLFAAALLAVQAVFSICAAHYTRKLSLVERIKAAD